jgi:hypothetical protein
MIDEWELGSLRWQYPHFDIAAQTFGTHIFVEDANTGDREQLVTLAHELVHVRQAQRAGSLGAFARDYCKAFWTSDFSYDRNALEVEAKSIEGDVRAALTR